MITMPHYPHNLNTKFYTVLLYKSGHAIEPVLLIFKYTSYLSILLYRLQIILTNPS